jgi:hypothetical protein
MEKRVAGLGGVTLAAEGRSEYITDLGALSMTSPIT